MSFREARGLLSDTARLACNLKVPMPVNYRDMDLADSDEDDVRGSRVQKVHEAEPTNKDVFASLRSRFEGAEKRASRNPEPEYRPDETELKEYLGMQLRDDSNMSPKEAARRMKLDLKMDTVTPLETMILPYRPYNPEPAPKPAPPAMLQGDESDEDEPLAERLKRSRACAGKPGDSEGTKQIKKPRTPITFGERARPVTIMSDYADVATASRRRKKAARNMKRK